jgi:hypothetical protein
MVGNGSLGLRFCHKEFQSPPQYLIVGSGVLDLGNEDVAGAGCGQFVHDKGDLLPQHHDGDGDPAGLFQRGDGRRAVAGGDLLGVVELAALDVVSAEDVFLRGWRRSVWHICCLGCMEKLTNDTLYPGCDQIDQLGV